MRALVGIAVSREWVETEFLKQMGTWHQPKDWQIRFGWFGQFTAAERHNVMVGEAYHNYDRLFFMDTDQIYPPEYFEMMLQHEEPVVTALNVSRYHPYEFTSYEMDGEEAYEGVVIPRYTQMEPPTDRMIYKCDLSGTGSMMLDPKILDKIEQPYFKDIFDPAGCRRLLPDDFYFCWQLYKADIPVVVDQNVIVKHLAKLTVSPYNTQDLRRAWDKVNSGWGITKDGKKA